MTTDVSRSMRVIARHLRKGGANGGAGERGRDGARSPDPGAVAMQGRRRRATGREAACPPLASDPLFHREYQSVSGG